MSTVQGKYLVVSPDKLKPNPWNPNSMTKEVMDAEKASIKKFGFVDPITVRESGKGYEVIDGEHRWRAAKELKLKEVPVINMGIVKDEVAKQLTIVLNETRGKAKAKELAQLIQELGQGGMALEDLAMVTPFTQDDLKIMVESLDGVDHVGRAADADRAEQTAIKMVVLHYFGKDYDQVKKALEKVQSDKKLKTQAEAAFWLCRAYLKGDVKK